MYRQRFQRNKNRFSGGNHFRDSRRGNRFMPSRQSVQEIIDAIRAQKDEDEFDNGSITEQFIPKHRFDDFNLSSQLVKNISFKNYTNPTPIQDQAIPEILAGKDVIGIANTGTGKTAAFLIPLIEKVNRYRNQKVLIITPTRELALQIFEEFKNFSFGLKLYSAVCIGGAKSGRQINDLRRNPNFVIGTPGRIKDFIQHKNINLGEFNNVVLDEADRMVDIGFVNEIKLFISMLPKERQSLFFSATISEKVNEILKSFVINPVTLSVKAKETTKNIKQELIKIHDRNKKIEILHDLLINKDFNKVLIFGRTKWGVQKLTNELKDRGFKAGAIHGNKGQGQRQKVLSEFKSSYINILLATDVASRGLDIENVTHVINYDMPSTYEDYIHRIGRTGRANKKGVALTFVD